MKESLRKWREKNPAKLKAAWERHKQKRLKEFDEFGIRVSEKLCPVCKLMRKASDFYICRLRNDGISFECIDCANTRGNWLGARRFDKKHNFTDTVSLQEWFNLILEKHCVYCGVFPARGADRINNKLGHSIINILPCCVVCNRARSDFFTVEEMQKIVGPAIASVRHARKVGV